MNVYMHVHMCLESVYMHVCICVYACVCANILKPTLWGTAHGHCSSGAIHLVYSRQKVLLPQNSPIQIGCQGLYQLSYLFSQIFIMSLKLDPHYWIAFHLCGAMVAWEAGSVGHVWKSSLGFESPTRVLAWTMKHPDRNESRHRLAPGFRQHEHLCHFTIAEPASWCHSDSHQAGNPVGPQRSFCPTTQLMLEFDVYKNGHLVLSKHRENQISFRNQTFWSHEDGRNRQPKESHRQSL